MSWSEPFPTARLRAREALPAALLRVWQALSIGCESAEAWGEVERDLAELLEEGFDADEWQKVGAIACSGGSRGTRTCAFHQMVWDCGVREAFQGEMKAPPVSRFVEFAFHVLVKGCEQREGDEWWGGMSSLDLMNILRGAGLDDEDDEELQNTVSTVLERLKGIERREISARRDRQRERIQGDISPATGNRDDGDAEARERKELGIMVRAVGWRRMVFMGENWMEGASVAMIATIAGVILEVFVSRDDWRSDSSLMGELEFLRELIGPAAFSTREWIPILQLLRRTSLMTVQTALRKLRDCVLLPEARSRWKDLVQSAAEMWASEPGVQPEIIPVVNLEWLGTPLGHASDVLRELSEGVVLYMPRSVKEQLVRERLGSFSRPVWSGFFADMDLLERQMITRQTWERRFTLRRNFALSWLNEWTKPGTDKMLRMRGLIFGLHLDLPGGAALVPRNVPFAYSRPAGFTERSLSEERAVREVVDLFEIPDPAVDVADMDLDIGDGPGPDADAATGEDAGDDGNTGRGGEGTDESNNNNNGGGADEPPEKNVDEEVAAKSKSRTPGSKESSPAKPRTSKNSAGVLSAGLPKDREESDDSDYADSEKGDNGDSGDSDDADAWEEGGSCVKKLGDKKTAGRPGAGVAWTHQIGPAQDVNFFVKSNDQYRSSSKSKVALEWGQDDDWVDPTLILPSKASDKKSCATKKQASDARSKKAGDIRDAIHDKLIDAARTTGTVGLYMQVYPGRMGVEMAITPNLDPQEAEWKRLAYEFFDYTSEISADWARRIREKEEGFNDEE
ncbi:hypothetical protein HD553DRAFT_325024 [Filobasidium floriforme]|nr:uncharacterized protein HD553DRAFT_326481 [Filobasidium floriforme]XP_046035578.1 uncharacterized protein HD553DRAFT_325024 [Filobasidium floriforme]KAH8079230.1 hypothetical protein HD553DRAFT_326481 [Filobasidium floriforme]KAH8082789.1 hypothetical protein HD553DRAFT_325024 [Filobasidium floriforme]